MKTTLKTPETGTARWIWPTVMTVFFAVMIGALIRLGVKNEETFHVLMREDAWAEWCTFLAFLTASVMAFDGMVRRSGNGLERVAFAGLGLFCLFVAGEEISWGQRLLGFTPPEIFLKENYQQEFEIHNVLRSISDSKWARSKELANLIAIAYGVASLVALIPGVPRLIGPHISLIPWLAFVVVMNERYPFDRTGEFTELVLGTVFVADIAMRRYGNDRYLGARTAVLALSGVLVVGITIPPTLEKLVYGKDTKRVTHAKEELELLKSDMFQEEIFQPHAHWKVDNKGRRKRKRRFHKRVYTAVKQHYIHFGTSSSFLGHELCPAEAPDGEGRNDNRGYFIDPWGQSYWIVHERRGKSTAVVVLYSMGPNRRRDMTTRELKKQFGETGTVVAGDDVGVYLEYQL